MMEVKSLEKEGSNLFMKGKVMSSIPISVYITPRDVWEGKNFLSWNIIRYMPIMIVKGFWQFRKEKKAEKRK